MFDLSINKTEIFDERGKWRRGHPQPKEWRKGHPQHDRKLLESIFSVGNNLFPMTTGEAQNLYNLAHHSPISIRQILNISRRLEQEGKITRKIFNCGKCGGRTTHIIWRKNK